MLSCFVLFVVASSRQLLCLLELLLSIFRLVAGLLKKAIALHCVGFCFVYGLFVSRNALKYSFMRVFLVMF